MPDKRVIDDPEYRALYEESMAPELAARVRELESELSSIKAEYQSMALAHGRMLKEVEDMRAKVEKLNGRPVFLKEWEAPHVQPKA